MLRVTLPCNGLASHLWLGGGGVEILLVARDMCWPDEPLGLLQTCSILYKSSTNQREFCFGMIKSALAKRWDKKYVE